MMPAVLVRLLVLLALLTHGLVAGDVAAAPVEAAAAHCGCCGPGGSNCGCIDEAPAAPADVPLAPSSAASRLPDLSPAPDALATRLALEVPAAFDRPAARSCDGRAARPRAALCVWMT